MLFRQYDLAYDPIQEASNILNESVYLDESEAVVSAKAIPVVENSRIGAYVVRFNDISTFAEDHGMNYENAIRSIAESNGINMDHLAVAVKETTIMANPGIVNELANVVVTPLPKTDSMYQFTEACVDAFIESGDTSYMDLLVEETTNAKTARDNAKLDMQNEKSTIKKLLKTIKYYGYNTPKERIAAALSALTKKYNKIIANIPEDKSKRKWYQSILKTIDNVIRKLTGFLNKKNGQKDKGNPSNEDKGNPTNPNSDASSERGSQEPSVDPHNNTSTSHNSGGSSNSSHSSAGSHTSNPRLYAPHYTIPSGNSDTPSLPFIPGLGIQSGGNPNLPIPKFIPRLGGQSGSVLSLPAPGESARDRKSTGKKEYMRNGIVLPPPNNYHSQVIRGHFKKPSKPQSFSKFKVKKYIDKIDDKLEPYFKHTRRPFK